MGYFFIYGPDFKKILYEYTGLTGRAPLPPKWSFGLWMSPCTYHNRKAVEDVARKLRRMDIPCDVLHIDPLWLKGRKNQKLDSCEFEWDKETFPKPEEMIEKVKEKGFKICLWENPYIYKHTATYWELAKKGYLVKDEKNKPTEVFSTHGLFKDYYVVDFTNPGAVEWYKEKHKKLLDMDVATFKCDYGDGAPEKAVYHNGKSGKEIHNLYPLLYKRTVFEAMEEYSGRGIIWARPAYAGSQRYPVLWSGDPKCSFPLMVATLQGGLSLALSGIAFWSHDIGGFIGEPEPELYIRWAQWGLLCSHSRYHDTTPREPWLFGLQALEIFWFYAKLRYRLIPYLYSYAHIAHLISLPIVRPPILDYQDDPDFYDKDLEYLLGKKLLVAPIFNETGRRNIYLLQGNWLDFWNDKE